jgi:hypothetical protein
MTHTTTGTRTVREPEVRERSPASLTIAGLAPAVVPTGTLFVVELRIHNGGPGSRAVNVYVRCPGTPIEGLWGRGARTRTGRFHGSAFVYLAGGAEAMLSLLAGPVARGTTVIRADAVSDDSSDGTSLAIEAQ